MLKLCIFFINFFLCLNLGWAQTSIPTQTTTPQYYPPLNPPPITITTPSLAAPPSDPPPAGTSSAPSDQTSPSGSLNDSNKPTNRPSLAVPGAATNAGDALTTMMGNVKASAGKYEEYQSICRTNHYDVIAYADGATQKKRVEDLKQKISESKSSTPFKIQLLKEYVDQRRRADVELYHSKLKEEKLSQQDDQVIEALFSFYRGDMKEAEKILSKVVQENRKNKEALLYLAQIYTSDANYFEAASAYLDLNKLTKEPVDLEMCEVLTLDSQYKDAEKYCKRASQTFENNPYPLIFLGVSQREMLNYEQSAHDFKESIKRKPTEMGYTCLGELFFIKEKYTGAVEFFKRALAVYPESARAMLGLAWAQFKDKKYDEAVESFKNSCRQDRRVIGEIRKAFKILTDEKSPSARPFADLAQKCSE